jgi:hypothetical protein
MAASSIVRSGGFSWNEMKGQPRLPVRVQLAASSRAGRVSAAGAVRRARNFGLDFRVASGLMSFLKVLCTAVLFASRQCVQPLINTTRNNLL